MNVWYEKMTFIERPLPLSATTDGDFKRQIEVTLKLGQSTFCQQFGLNIVISVQI